MFLQTGGEKMIDDAIKKIANGRDISIRSLERVLNYANGTISKWNSRSPKISQVEQVADCLQVLSEYLLNKSKKRPHAKITPTVPMEVSEDKVIVDRTEYEQLKHDADSGTWLTTADIIEGYHHKMDWFKEKFFYQQKYKKLLSDEFGGQVHYSNNENGRNWNFEPNEFKQFMEKYFPEINRG